MTVISFMLCLKDNVLDVIINSSQDNRGWVQTTYLEKEGTSGQHCAEYSEFLLPVLINEMYRKICPDLMQNLFY